MKSNQIFYRRDILSTKLVTQPNSRYSWQSSILLTRGSGSWRSVTMPQSTPWACQKRRSISNSQASLYPFVAKVAGMLERSGQIFLDSSRVNDSDQKVRRHNGVVTGFSFPRVIDAGFIGKVESSVMLEGKLFSDIDDPIGPLQKIEISHFQVWTRNDGYGRTSNQELGW